MARFIKKNEKTIGQVPGDLIFNGVQRIKIPTIQMIDYNQNDLTDIEVKNINDVFHYKDTSTATWINVNGLHDTELIRKIGKGFNLHSLVLEDIVNTGQRPHMEEYDGCLFFVLKMMKYDKETGKVLSEQLSLVLGESFLLTFQEQEGDVFDPVRERIRKQKGRIRKVGIDYLAYTLLDTIVDNYLFIIERMGEQIEELETKILDNPNQEILYKINDYKREMNYLSKTIRAANEFIIRLGRLDSDLINEANRPFLKDLADLSSQAVEVIDTYRVMLSDYLNIYNSQINNRLNEIMKVLTIFSAIFIPITFIAGIYGTNFVFIPELRFKFGYFIMLGVMAIIVFFMLRFFRRKKWL